MITFSSLGSGVERHANQTVPEIPATSPVASGRGVQPEARRKCRKDTADGAGRMRGSEVPVASPAERFSSVGAPSPQGTAAPARAVSLQPVPEKLEDRTTANAATAPTERSSVSPRKPVREKTLRDFANQTSTGGRDSAEGASSGARPLSQRERTRRRYRVNP